METNLFFGASAMCFAQREEKERQEDGHLEENGKPSMR